MTHEKALRSRRTPSPRRIARYFSGSRRLKLVCAFAIVAYLLLSASSKLWADYLSDTATDFGLLGAPTTSPSFPPPEHPERRLIRTANGAKIDGRYRYLKPLAAGCEGNTALYYDEDTEGEVVVKSFRTQSRNRLPGYMRTTFAGKVDYWPAEIPATLLLGGTTNLTTLNNTIETADLSTPSDFVPAVDYFLVTNDESGAPVSPTWRLVTPFIRGGTLLKLASKMKEESSQHLHELDATLRLAFNRLLTALLDLHAKGLCHDDIKIDNVFPLDQTRWLIGDLGRVREIQHPYHFNRGWHKKNQWADCRVNDVRRALKTYLTVLRTAAADLDYFDMEFYAERQPWSRLYWDFMRRPALAGELLGRSLNRSVEHVQEPPVEASAIATAGIPPHTGKAREALRLAVERELKGTRIAWNLKTWWILGGFMPKYALERNLYTTKAEFVA